MPEHIEITNEEFWRYEKVRQSGLTNMFDIETVQKASGLSKGRVIEIMKNYNTLKKRVEKGDDTK